MFEKLVAFASRQLDIEASTIAPDTTFESLGIDSLDVVEMVMELEDELGVELDLENEKIVTFQDLADCIEARMN